MRPGPGAVLGERYRLTTRIAVGGMGEVWRATDDILGRDVAVKVLKEEYSGDAGFRERFRAEARHSAALTHPNIAGVYDYGEADGSAYLVMELVPGEPLSDLLEREGSLAPREAMGLVAQAAAGLAAAHAAGVVHRDVKPGNLLVTPDGRVKVTDFGIARVADAVPLTATGQVMGTAQYLAPEQAMGRGASPASDVYALGVVAYEALTGRRPFDGDSHVAVAMAHVNSTAPPLPASVPAGARTLVEASMAKEPAHRPRNAEVFASAASALARGDDGGALHLLTGVPGAAGATAGTGAADDQTTRLLPLGPGDATQALPGTSTAPRTAPGTSAVPTHQPHRRRRGLTGPLLALLALVAFLLLGAWLSGNPLDDGTPGADPTVAPSLPTEAPAETEPAPEETEPAATRTSTAPAEITVEASAYEGLDAAEARRLLESLGLEVSEEPRDAEGVEPGTVLAVSEGTYQPGETVTIVVATAPAGPTEGGADEEQPDEGNSDEGNPGQGNDRSSGDGNRGQGNEGGGAPGDDGEGD